MRALPILVVLLLGAARAHADEPAERGTFTWNLPDRSYLWDGGVVPFLYLPLALMKPVRALDPPDQPVGFAPTEGGRHYANNQYPAALLYVQATAAGAAILFAGDDSRWFHLKGFAEGVITTQLLTSIAKNTFGRHRPHYDLGADAINDADSRRSFWSGHASSTLATATYLGLYARYHLFARWREPGTLPWWEGLAYAGLVAGALAIPYSQWALDRHHASDVIVGSAVGAGVSAAFFFYQERRYRHTRTRDRDAGLVFAPEINPEFRGFSISGRW